MTRYSRNCCVEVERIEREDGVLLDALLKERQDAGLTQAQVA